MIRSMRTRPVPTYESSQVDAGTVEKSICSTFPIMKNARLHEREESVRTKHVINSDPVVRWQKKSQSATLKRCWATAKAIAEPLGKRPIDGWEADMAWRMWKTPGGHVK